MTADTRAHDSAALTRFELFLVAAVATVLITRAYLAATGYPQIGSGTLHIAHVLWGGLLMAAALVAVAITEGTRVRVLSALAGGIGFGLFVDEIGKFVTKDVDYFFQPAIAMIYVVFVLFYLVAREAITRAGPPDERRLAIGADAVTDLALGQLDDVRRRSVLAVLDGVRDPRFGAMSAALREALLTQDVPKTSLGSRVVRARNTAARHAESVLGHRMVRRIVLVLFVVQAATTVASVALALVTVNDDAADNLSDTLVQVSSAVSGALAVLGVWFLWRGPYLRALRLLRASVIVNLLVTQVFLFDQEQLGALTGFAVAALMLACLQIAIRIEEDFSPTTAPDTA
ncbi:hypothetical protein ACFYVR_26070 [Rhodococcus sp. NPDC003318]|uniref:hypothetical protein n=1 Tax=Rhodococcus sp. NPDC003318 TaxID=3364503 RepID=UPI0036956BEE